MKFQRFGNAFVARDGDTLYVVSLYLSVWTAHYLTPDMTRPEQIGLYGHATPLEACNACTEWSER